MNKKIPVTKIISGGQTGVDRAGLNAAISLGLQHGGWCPKGRKAEDGEVPRMYHLVETASSGYPERTKLNVKESDATVIFTQHPAVNAGGRMTVHKLSRGSKLTEEHCVALGKPYLVVLPDNDKRRQALAIWDFIKKHKVNVLNVAGPRASSWPEGFQSAITALKMAIGPCPDDTNGDGDCGRKLCPFCGEDNP